MKIQGTHNLPQPPAEVFAALTNPDMLQRSITGCERLEKTGEDEYNAHLKLGLAAVKGSYTGKVRLSGKQVPDRFTLHLEGKGGPGFVKGTCAIELKAEGGGTCLSYAADVQVGGLIAAVGSRMIEAAAKKLAAEFFQKFGEVLGGPN